MVFSLFSVVLSSKLKTIFSWASKMVWWEGCGCQVRGPGFDPWGLNGGRRADFQKLSPERHTCTKHVPPNICFSPLSPSRWYKCSNTLSQSAPTVAFPHTAPLTTPLSVLSLKQNFREIMGFNHQSGLRIPSTLNPAQRQCPVEYAVLVFFLLGGLCNLDSCLKCVSLFDCWLAAPATHHC